MEFTEHIALPGLTAMAKSDEATAEVRFAELVNRRSRFVFRVAYSVLRNAHDSEDVVQDLFFKLYRSGAWQAMEDEQAFLARSAWRLAIDRVPRLRAVPQPELSIASHEQRVIDGDMQAVVHRLIDALPEEFRQPLVLSAIEEMTSRQIAVVLDIPEGTVRNRIMRARQMLKEKLAARLEARHE
jgi:RNA polymerase sigma-70 factor (ECF subfamily)